MTLPPGSKVQLAILKDEPVNNAILLPRVFVPVPLILIFLACTTFPENKVTSPFPVKLIVTVALLVTPPEATVNSVPDVPERVIVEEWGVNVPVDPIVSVPVFKAKFELLVSSISFIVMLARTGVLTLRVIGSPAVIVTVSPVPGRPPTPLHVPVQSAAVFQAVPVPFEAQEPAKTLCGTKNIVNERKTTERPSVILTKFFIRLKRVLILIN